MIYRKELKTLKEYVPGKPIEDVMREYNLTDIVKLASNENPLGTSPKALEKINSELNNLNIYPDGAALLAREEIANHLGLKQENILIGNGGEEIIKMLCTTLINEEDELIMPWPSFSLYEIAANIMGGVVKKSQLNDDFSINVDEMLSMVTDKTKLFCICTPNNPTGNIVSSKDMLRIAKELPEEVVLFIDEAYYDYALLNDDYVNSIEIMNKRANTVILRTFSKVCGLAGLRAGYLIAEKSFISQMIKVKNVFNSNRLAQAAARGALEDQEFIDATVKLNYQSLDILEKFCDEMNLKYAKSNANFIWIELNKSSREVNEELLKLGVIIRAGFLWGAENYIRVSTGTIEQTNRCVEALRKVLK